MEQGQGAAFQKQPHAACLLESSGTLWGGLRAVLAVPQQVDSLMMALRPFYTHNPRDSWDLGQFLE